MVGTICPCNLLATSLIKLIKWPYNNRELRSRINRWQLLIINCRGRNSEIIWLLLFDRYEWNYYTEYWIDPLNIAPISHLLSRFICPQNFVTDYPRYLFFLPRKMKFRLPLNVAADNLCPVIKLIGICRTVQPNYHVLRLDKFHYYAGHFHNLLYYRVKSKLSLNGTFRALSAPAYIYMHVSGESCNPTVHRTIPAVI